MVNIETRTRNNGQEEYRVQGTDGWTFVTNNPTIAKEESSKTERNYGQNRITRCVL